MGNFGGLGEPAPGVFGRALGHVDGLAGKAVKGLIAEIGGRGYRLALADQYPEAEIGGFGAFNSFGLAQALAMGQRRGLEEHRVGVGGATFSRFRDQAG